jgi:orotate phosphoribosyltransferase-like protein
LALITLCFVLDEVITDGKTISRWLQNLLKLSPLKRLGSLKKWWDKEE